MGCYFLTSFYANYVALCAKAKKSLSAVAESVGLSRTAPNGWKKGKQPSEVTLEKLSQYFGIPVSDLTGEQKEMPISREPADGLTEEEKMYVEWFRNASDAEREIVKRIMNGGGS